MRFVPSALLGWLLLAEVGSEVWYRRHESCLPAPARWTITLPPGVTLLDRQPPSAKTKQILRFDSAQQLIWQDTAGHLWQLIYLSWAQNRVAARLANDHTPAICLPAAGKDILREPELMPVQICRLNLDGTFYTAADYHHARFHLFYCFGQDQFDPIPAPQSLWQQRLLPVFQGRRHAARYSLELAVWGFNSEAEARTALLSQLQTIIHL